MKCIGVKCSQFFQSDYSSCCLTNDYILKGMKCPAFENSFLEIKIKYHEAQLILLNSLEKLIKNNQED